MPQSLESIESLVTQARSLKQSGRLQDAIEIWRNIVARNPAQLAYQHNLAATLGDAGRNHEAAEIAADTIGKGLDRPETYMVYARALAGIHDIEKAKKAYRTLITKTPVDATAHRELAQLVWMETGDADKTEAALVTAIEQNPDALALKIIRAEIKGQIGDPVRQFDLLNDLVNSNNHHPQICYYAARAALASKKFTQALTFSQLAHDGAPDEDDVAGVHVSALLANGEATFALSVLDRLRQRQPDNQHFVALQATAWRLLGDSRYQELFDYDTLVFAAPLETPPGWSTLSAYLDELSAALHEAHCYCEHPFFQSVRHGSQISSITKSENIAMKSFAKAVEGPLATYVDRLGAGNDQLRRRNKARFELLDAWSVLLPPKGFHVNHVHPAGWLSSACHIEPAVEDADDPKAGWLKFGEPGCTTEPTLEPEKFIKPQAGQMVIFPSYMWHGTVPFSKGTARLTVAADFAP